MILFRYFFRSANSATFFIALHLIGIYGLYCIVSTFEGQNPWFWLALYLVQGVFVLYYIKSEQHRKLLVAMKDGLLYPDIMYHPNGNVYWKDGGHVADLLTWISAMRHVPRSQVLDDWAKGVEGSYLKDRNRKDHDLYMVDEFTP